MLTIQFILQLVAIALLLAAAINVANKPRLVWGWAGMFLWLLSLMLGALPLHPINH